ncbi:MAG: hypothetical protein ACLQVJ_04760 [Syntrophobacteraceae bacterium]
MDLNSNIRAKNSIYLTPAAPAPEVGAGFVPISAQIKTSSHREKVRHSGGA